MDLEELLTTAEKWQIISLKRRVVEIMVVKLDHENVENFAVLSETMQCRKLTAECRTFMLKESLRLMENLCQNAPEFSSRFFLAKTLQSPKRKCYRPGCINEAKEPCTEVTPGCDG